MVNHVQLNSMINLESDMQVRAAGALVAILQEEMILDSLDQDAGVDSRVTLGSITEISLYLSSRCKSALCMMKAFSRS